MQDPNQEALNLITPAVVNTKREMTKPFNYRPEIDGLRAIAVIAVIINHANPGLLPSGYLGVDIFFVISGYVITNSLSKGSAKNLGDLLLTFYSRRIKRLFPALIVCVLLTALLICLFDPSPAESLKTGIAALVGGSNLYLFQRATDYFAPSSQLNVFTHTWSLGVEEQFYFFYPVLLWYALKPPPGRRLLNVCGVLFAVSFMGLVLGKVYKGSALAFLPGGINSLYLLAPYAVVALVIPISATFKPWNSHQRNAKVWLTVLAALSLSFFYWAYDRDFAAAYFLMPARFWELAAGCLLFLWFQNRQPAKLPAGSDLLVILAMLAALFLPESMGKQATILLVALTTFLMACLRPTAVIYPFLTHPWVLRIGVISYSLYLWHWSVLSLSRWTIGMHPISLSLQLVVMLLLALASYHWIEQPFRSPKLLASRLKILGSGITAAAVAIAVMFALDSQAKQLSLDRRFPSDLAEQLAKGVAEFHTNRIDHRVDPNLLTKGLTLNDAGGPLPRPRVYLLGDSHADHYKNALQAMLPDRGVGGGSIGWRCGYISPRDIEPLTRQWMTGCEDYKIFIDGFLDSELQPGDVVIVAQRWNEKKVGNHLATVLDKLASRLATKDVTLILIDDVPELAVENPLLCEKRPWRPFPMPGCFQSLATVNRNQEKMDLIGTSLQQSHANVQYLKLRQLYCDGSVCGPYVKGTMIYRDNNHLNRAGSLLGARRIAEQIRALHPG
jgi:peptidoglycan/LPS O-acetylase OafA/YrhL